MMNRSEAHDRKARSEARLRAEGVPINPHLPVIETADEAQLRSQDAVVDRAVASMIVAVKAEGHAQRADVRHTQGLARHIHALFGGGPIFSPKEQAFLDDGSPDEQTYVEFVWQYEVLGVLVWALGYEDALTRPDRITDVVRNVGLLKELGPAAFRQNARLRSAAEILDEADPIYRYDWACVDARIKGRPSPAGLDGGVVVERHRALNWLIGYQGQAWDDVSTDT